MSTNDINSYRKSSETHQHSSHLGKSNQKLALPIPEVVVIPRSRKTGQTTKNTVRALNIPGVSTPWRRCHGNGRRGQAKQHSSDYSAPKQAISPQPTIDAELKNDEMISLQPNKRTPTESSLISPNPQTIPRWQTSLTSHLSQSRNLKGQLPEIFPKYPKPPHGTRILFNTVNGIKTQYPEYQPSITALTITRKKRCNPDNNIYVSIFS